MTDEPNGEPLLPQFAQTRWLREHHATEIMLLRHGASQPYVPGEPFPLVDGTGDPPLSEVGHTQAELSAGRLAAEPICEIYVTNLQRTAQTAAPLAAKLGLEPIVEPRLREVGLGEWDGGLIRQRAAEGHPLYAKIKQEQRWDVIPGAESNDALRARTMAALSDIADRHVGELVLCTVHGGVIGAVLSVVTGSEPFAFASADNCSVSQIVRTDGVWQLRRFNDSSHLWPLLHHGQSGP